MSTPFARELCAIGINNKLSTPFARGLRAIGLNIQNINPVRT
jgi:hypothetical protein